MSDATVHATVTGAQKEFFRLQVAAAFYVADVPGGGGGGAVGEVNRAISSAARACIDQLPSDRYSLNSNEAMMLALRRLMQARDAVLASVATANATPMPTLRSLCLDALARSNTPATVLPPQLHDDLVKLRQLQAEVAAARIFGRATVSSPSSIVRCGTAILEEHSWHAMQRASGMPGPWTGVQHASRASRK